MTVPLLAIIWAVLVACLPVVLIVVGLLDVVRPTRSWARTRAVLAIVWIACCEVVGVAASLLLWIVFLLHRSPARFVDQNTALQRHWTNALFAGSKKIFGMTVITEGLEAVGEGPFIVLVRHASLVDTVLTAAVLANPGRLRLRYVLKNELLSDPCIDIVGHRLNNAFVSRGDEPELDLALIRGLTQELSDDEGVLIYPEGTRFSPGKLQKLQKRLGEDPVFGSTVAKLRHVLPPRPGGTLALLDEAPELDVVVLAHKGLEGAATLADFWHGELVGATLRVEAWRIAAAEIPIEARHDPTWLLEKWAEVDDWVGRA